MTGSHPQHKHTSPKHLLAKVNLPPPSVSKEHFCGHASPPASQPPLSPASTLDPPLPPPPPSRPLQLATLCPYVHSPPFRQSLGIAPPKFMGWGRERQSWLHTADVSPLADTPIGLQLPAPANRWPPPTTSGAPLRLRPRRTAPAHEYADANRQSRALIARWNGIVFNLRIH